MAPDRESTIALLWTSTMLSTVISFARLAARKWRRQQLTQGDYFTLLAVVCVVLRVIFIHLVTVWGTTNTIGDQIMTGTLPAYRERQIVIASKLLVASRVAHTVLLWSLKLAVLDLCKQLLDKSEWRGVVTNTCYVVFCITFVGVLISGLVECRPIDLYWQLRPSAGSCVSGNLWLIVYGGCNIFTDLMLMAIPWPLLIKVKVCWRKKFRLCILFSLGVFLVAATIMRMVLTFKNAHDQLNRTIWVSIETVVANLVAHTPVIYPVFRRKHKEREYFDLSGHPEFQGGGEEGGGEEERKGSWILSRTVSGLTRISTGQSQRPAKIRVDRAVSFPFGEAQKSPEEWKDWGYNGGRHKRVGSVPAAKTHHSVDLDNVSSADGRSMEILPAPAPAATDDWR